MLTAFAAIQELLKKLFESNGGSKGSKLAIFLVHIWWIPGAHLIDSWCTSDGFLAIIWWISGAGPQEFPWSVSDWGEQEGWVSWMASGSEAHILQLKVWMCLQNYWKVFAPLTPRIRWTTSISSDVLTWVLPGLVSWGKDLNRQWSPKQNRIHWNCKDWPWSQTPATQTCSIGGVLCPAGPKSTSPPSKSIHVKVFLARVTP